MGMEDRSMDLLQIEELPTWQPALQNSDHPIQGPAPVTQRGEGGHNRGSRCPGGGEAGRPGAASTTARAGGPPLCCWECWNFTPSPACPAQSPLPISYPVCKRYYFSKQSWVCVHQCSPSPVQCIGKRKKREKKKSLGETLPVKSVWRLFSLNLISTSSKSLVCSVCSA